MQLVSKAKTPKEVRDELVTFIRNEAIKERNFEQMAKRTSSKNLHSACARKMEEIADFINSIQDGAN